MQPLTIVHTPDDRLIVGYVVPHVHAGDRLPDDEGGCAGWEIRNGKFITNLRSDVNTLQMLVHQGPRHKSQLSRTFEPFGIPRGAGYSFHPCTSEWDTIYDTTTGRWLLDN